MPQHIRFLVFLIGFIANTSYAGLLIEPHLGLLIGNGEKTVNFNDGSGSLKMDTEYLGPSYGAKLGYHSVGVTIGLDYSRSTYEVEAKAQTNTSTWNSITIGTEKYDVDDSYFGLFIGYQLPVLFRVWGTYYLSAERKLTKDSTGTGIFKKNDKMDGSGFAFGLGYNFMPLSSLNLEYRTIDFDPNTGGVDTTSAIGRKYDSKDTQILLSISIPIQL